AAGLCAEGVVVGIGAAATHDAGLGLVRALAGAPDGAEIAGPVLAAAHAALEGADVVVAAASLVPLLGLHGAGAMLGERIGPAEAQRLDTRIGELVAHLDRLGRALPARTSLLPGPDGAGGASLGGHAHAGPTHAPARPGPADG